MQSQSIDTNQEKLITIAIIVGFTAQLFCQILLFIFMPPDMSGKYPVYIPESLALLEFSAALFIAGSTIMGIKLADEQKVLPSAGFTMLAITSGVLMASLFEIAFVSSEESYEKFYFIQVCGNFLYFPSMLLISSYTEFKKWIRYLGVISTLPLLTSCFLFLFHYRNFVMLENISNSGFGLMGFTMVMWAFNVYTNYKKKLKEKTANTGEISSLHS